jgi:hypothetical protein
MVASAATRTSLRPEIASRARLSSRNALPVPSVSTCGLCLSSRSPLPPAFPATIFCPESGQHQVTGVLRSFSRQRDLRACQLFGDNSPRMGREILEGGTAGLRPNSSLFAAWRQNYFSCCSLRVTLRPAWVPGRSDLKQVSCAYGCSSAVFLEKFPHFSCR